MATKKAAPEEQRQRVARNLRLNLRRLCDARDWTQADLADAAGITLRAVQTYHARENLPRVDVALRMAQALGTTVDALLSDPPG